VSSPWLFSIDSTEHVVNCSATHTAFRGCYDVMFNAFYAFVQVCVCVIYTARCGENPTFCPNSFFPFQDGFMICHHMDNLLKSWWYIIHRSGERVTQITQHVCHHRATQWRPFSFGLSVCLRLSCVKWVEYDDACSIWRLTLHPKTIFLLPCQGRLPKGHRRRKYSIEYVGSLQPHTQQERQLLLPNQPSILISWTWIDTTTATRLLSFCQAGNTTSELGELSFSPFPVIYPMNPLQTYVSVPTERRHRVCRVHCFLSSGLRNKTIVW